MEPNLDRLAAAYRELQLTYKAAREQFAAVAREELAAGSHVLSYKGSERGTMVVIREVFYERVRVRNPATGKDYSLDIYHLFSARRVDLIHARHE